MAHGTIDRAIRNGARRTVHCWSPTSTTATTAAAVAGAGLSREESYREAVTATRLAAGSAKGDYARWKDGGQVNALSSSTQSPTRSRSPPPPLPAPTPIEDLVRQLPVHHPGGSGGWLRARSSAASYAASSGGSERDVLENALRELQQSEAEVLEYRA
jgi:hypothetical protein